MTSQRTLEYQPSLDGLRALAVTLVVVFHGGATWLTGGYVGVSVFFTLSGYLITNLLITEHDRRGTIDIGRFYARRVKRLLPASLLCLALIMIAAAAGVFEVTSALRRDLFGALFQVANWVKLFGGSSYADLTNATLGRVGPLEHYWSLAIEEQFYWVWPLVMLGVLGRVRSAAGRWRALVGFAVVAAIAAPVIALHWGSDAAYWSTPARAGEILVGAATAAGLRRFRSVPSLALPLTALGLAVIVWAAATWPADSGPAYSGWLPVFALATAAVIVGLQHPHALRTALSIRPVVWIGTVSYGIYLFHWPLFAALTPERVGFGGLGLFIVRVAATLALAATSAHILEQPVRRWDPPPLRPLLSAVVATMVVGFAVTIVAPSSTSAQLDAAALAPVDGTLAPLEAVATTSSAPSIDPGTTAVVTSATAATTVAPAPTTTAPAWQATMSVAPRVTPSRPVRALVIGDSTAEALGAGFVAWAVDHPDEMQVTVAAAPGCGFIRSGTIPTDGSIDFSGRCADVLDHDVPAAIDDLAPDIAILMVTMRDVEDRIWDESEGPITPFDPRFRERLLADYRALADRLLAAGVPHIVWIHAPHPAAAFAGEQRKMRDPARYEVQFSVIDQVARERPDQVLSLDLNTWMAERDLIRDTTMRPDGMHLTPEAASSVIDDYVAGWVIWRSVT